VRQISVPTLERWLYAYRRGGLAALRPQPRSDRGRARELTPAQRELLLDIRREHPTASAPLILRTLVADGRLGADVVSATTVARLYRDAGLERGVRPDGHTRLRWQADHAGALWHGDVCHGPTLRIGATTRPLRIHALLDDASRYVVALEAHHTEREADMLDLLLAALRRHGAPDGFYLDNGSTYSGVALRLCCERLGITSGPRAALRRAGARQDGAVLAHASRRLPRPPRRHDLAARRAGAPRRVPRRALPPRAARRAARQDPGRGVGQRELPRRRRAALAPRSPSIAAAASARTAPSTSTAASGSSTRASSPAAS
jgi:transposase InsO family protein